MNVFIDDERVPGDVTWVRLPTLPEGEKWTIVRSYKEFHDLLSVTNIKSIKNISFDHDLGFGHGLRDQDCPTGKDCAELLVNYCWDNKLQLPNYTVHSMNPIGADNIKGYLVSAERHLRSL